jgi:hypothetical protein
MTDFKKQGGTLSGREERLDRFTGEPKSIQHTLGSHKTGQPAGGHNADNNLTNATSIPKSRDAVEPGSG